MSAPMRIMDCNVHHRLRNPAELLPYLPEPWKSQVKMFGLRAPRQYGPPSETFIEREFACPDSGAAADPARLAEGLLDRYGMDYAILTGTMYGIAVHADPDYSAALASAWNDHLLDRWLTADPRYRGAMTVSMHDPDQAVREIERIGSHPSIVQISVTSGARIPYGHRCHDPVFEAAARHGLPIALHPGTEGGGISNPPTAAGYVGDYLQFHAVMPQSPVAHLASMIGEGVFERFPELRIIIAGSGVSWLPQLLWRMDRSYKALRASVPALKRLPSEYVREHVYVTTQPIEQPDRPEQLKQLAEWLDMESRLLFASGYPDWDFDDPSQALAGWPEESRRRICFDNARALYRL